MWWVRVGVLFGLDLIAIGAIAAAAAATLRVSRMSASLLAASAALGLGQIGLWFAYQGLWFEGLRQAALDSHAQDQALAALFTTQALVFNTLGATRWGLAAAGALVGRTTRTPAPAGPPASTA